MTPEELFVMDRLCGDLRRLREDLEAVHTEIQVMKVRVAVMFTMADRVREGSEVDTILPAAA